MDAMLVLVCVCACVGRVAGCLPVFSLARLHTAAWQQRAGQLNSLDGEKRAREGREGKGRRRQRRGGKKRGGGTLRARHAWEHTHTHTRAVTHMKAIYMPQGTERGL